MFIMKKNKRGEKKNSYHIKKGETRNETCETSLN